MVLRAVRNNAYLMTQGNKTLKLPSRPLDHLNAVLAADIGCLYLCRLFPVQLQTIFRKGQLQPPYPRFFKLKFAPQILRPEQIAVMPDLVEEISIIQMALIRPQHLAHRFPERHQMVVQRIIQIKKYS
ncbi:hypothetical protein D3C75_675040 [compost metagenome]